MSNVTQPLYQMTEAPYGIYAYLLNQYWPLADQTALHNIFGANPDVLQVSALPGDNPTIGPDITDSSFLWQPAGSDTWYFMCTGDNMAYGIGSLATISYYQLNGTVITAGQSLSDWVMANSQLGTTILAPG
jgi:hypothetical protein